MGPGSGWTSAQGRSGTRSDRQAGRPAADAERANARARGGHRDDPPGPGGGTRSPRTTEIWVGAVGAGMLGDKAASATAGCQPVPRSAGLAEGRIDDAAVSAGGDPVEVRRLLASSRPTTRRWAQWLADLALTYGTSTIVTSDTTRGDPAVRAAGGARGAAGSFPAERSGADAPALPTREPDPAWGRGRGGTSSTSTTTSGRSCARSTTSSTRRPAPWTRPAVRSTR